MKNTMQTSTAEKGFLGALDYFFVLRPMLFFPAWSTLLAGFFIVDKQRLLLRPHEWLQAPHITILWLFFLFALAMGGSFLLNQLQDVESDRKNNKLFIISQGHISQRAAWMEALVLLSAAVVLGFATSAAVGWILMGFVVITAYLYNFRPWRMKDYPWRSLWANAAMGWLAFALGYAAGNNWDRGVVLSSLPYLFLNTALYLYTTLPDRAGDQQSNKQTLSVKYSVKTVMYGALFLYGAAWVSALGEQDYTVLLILALSAPFFIRTAFIPTTASAVLTTKYTIFFFSMVVCLKWPFYFILMVIGFYATRWYFKRRFQFDYPNFKER